MAWPHIEPSTPHLIYLLLSLFLIVYALFSELIRNRAHLSEPPLATLVGIIFGPRGFTVLNPISWGWEDNITQELARVIVVIQVFAVGIDLPAGYVKHHWKSIAILLGPNMIFGWAISAFLIYFTLHTSLSTALIISACLTPTDPVLSASVLGEARFSQRIPLRVRHLLSAESGCNDGTSFPFLYAALFAVIRPTAAKGIQAWFTDVIFWQCIVGSLIGTAIGLAANRALRFAEIRGYVQEATLFVFYLLLAIFCVGVGSTLGLDDFLVGFAAGTAFCWDGWFTKKTHKMKLPSIIDLLLNSAFFVYFGAIIPWDKFTGHINPGRLLGCVVLILLLRRLPAILALKWLLPEFKTYFEAIFAGHFGPMGVGALFLAIEARARLETGTSEPLPRPPKHSPNYPHQDAVEAVWPVICFVVLGSIMVHGCSAVVMSLASHFIRDPKERAPLIGSESERLYGMVDDSPVDSEEENGNAH